MSDVPERPQRATDVAGNDWFRRFPNGGTVLVSNPPTPSSVNHVGSRFREMPNGGGTVNRPTGGGTTFTRPWGNASDWTAE